MRAGRSLRALRKRRGLTLGALSALSGVHRDDLGRYERGEAVPRPETVRKLARALGAPISAVSGGMAWMDGQEAEAWEREDGLLYKGILEDLGMGSAPEAAAALLELVKASIPALVERMKDTRPEAEIARELLRELDVEDAPPADRWALTEEQWERVRGLLPPEKAGRGRAFKSNRLMLDGIVYWMKSGASWRDLPERFGRWRCVADRLQLWRRSGVWEPVEAALLELGVLDKM